MATQQTGKASQAKEPEQIPVPTQKPKFTVKQSISIPWITFTTDQMLYIRITDKIHPSPVPAQGDKKPGDCVTALMLEDGNRRMMGITAVLKSRIEEAFPNHSYVGKDFAIMETGKKRGRVAGNSDYHTFSIDEIQWNAPIPGMV